MTQEFASVHDEGITNTTTNKKDSKKELECEPPSNDEPQSSSIDRRNSSLNQQQNKYDTEACLSIDPIESGSGSKDAVKYQDGASTSALSSTWEECLLFCQTGKKLQEGFNSQINYTQNKLRYQFSIQGLQSTLLQSTMIPKLQIVHIRGNHWITVSTLLSIVNIYDSLYHSVDEGSYSSFLVLRRSRGTSKDFNDCGLFAIAYTVQLAKKRNPEKSNFHQSQIRSHLVNC